VSLGRRIVALLRGGIDLPVGSMSTNPYQSPLADASSLSPRQIVDMILQGSGWELEDDHDYRVVRGDQFGHLSQTFYERTCTDLQSLGFSLLGDLEDVTANRQSPSPRTFIRIMVDRPRTVVAAFYHIKPPIHWRLMMRLFGIPSQVVELESYTQTGCFYSTSTIPRRIGASLPATIQRQFVARGTPVPALYDQHRRALDRSPGPILLSRLGAMQDVIDHQNRMNRELYRYWRKLQGLSRRQLLAWGVPTAMVDEVAAHLHQEIVRRTDEESGNASS
jgi:hypothetical protein